MSAARILIVDDDASVREILEFNLKDLGLEVITAESAERAWLSFQESPPALTLTDVRMEGMSGLELLAQIRRRDPGAIVIVMTSYGSVQQAVEAMREGAHDYVTKPFDREALRLTIRRAMDFAGMREENVRLRGELSGRFTFSSMTADSPAMKDVLQVLARVAPTNATVLIEGETGTGKELVARSIHYMSERSSAKFVTVNCAAIPRELLESELFGHMKGAFTGATAARTGKFELADGGTLFLDEIGEIDLDLQKKLLRVLQEHEIDKVGAPEPISVDVRVVAATNRSLEDLVQAQEFREDLYYRLSVVPVRLPPLRERREDVRPLIERFLDKHGGEAVVVSENLLRALEGRAWPGNVRELENTIERLLILRKHPDQIDENDLLLTSATQKRAQQTLKLPDEGVVLDEVERDLIEAALEKTGGNQSAAARLLGITRQTLIYRIQKFSIEKPPPPKP